jgi:hypothetical protein
MELSMQQKKVVRWQWIIMGCCVAFILLSLIWGPLVPHLADLPQSDIILTSQFGVAGLMGLTIGILSVVYKVTILGRRITFWKPVTGGDAIFHGVMGIVGGLFLLGMATWNGLPLLQALQVSPWLCGGILFGVVMLVFLFFGLRRALEE